MLERRGGRTARNGKEDWEGWVEGGRELGGLGGEEGGLGEGMRKTGRRGEGGFG